MVEAPGAEFGFEQLLNRADECSDVGGFGVERQHGSLDAVCADLAGHALGFVLCRSVGADHVGSGSGEVQGGGAAEAAAGAGDESDFCGHGGVPFRFEAERFGLSGRKDRIAPFVR